MPAWMQKLATFVLISAVGAACGSRPAPVEAPPAPAGQASGAVTFTKQVAPILYANCVTCHRPGQIAPFSLVSYDDAKRHAGAIADATGARQMPPWLAAPGEFAFVGARRLTDDQIATLRQWAGSGAPEGDPKDLPAVPAFPEGWQLGQPDLVVTMPQPFMLAPGDTDRYRQIVYPLSLPAGRFVRAVELRPGTSPVHHAIIRIDPTRSSRRHDAEDKDPGFEGGMALDAKNPDGHFVGWSPGRGPITSPDGMPWRLDRGVDLVVELHLIPGKTVQPVQPMIGLYFTDTPPVQTPVELTIGVRTLDIPAGDASYRVTSSFTLPVDVTLISLYPHAHYLGKAVQVTATLPDGTTKHLLNIPRWDFHWQTEYRLEKPLPLPRGTAVTMDYTYDNSAANEDNPSSPPKRVLYGLRSSDEMATLAMQVLTTSPADTRRLTASVYARAAQESLDGAQMNATREPNNPQYQWDLGRSLVEAGRPAEALAPLQAAVQGLPRHARAHDFLGRVLFAAGRREEALAQFQQAATLDPGDELLPYDLGKVLAELGRIPEAVKAFQQALAVNPDYGLAYAGLGVALLRAGKTQEAVQAFQRSVVLAPDSAEAENGLAVALAQSGRTPEALDHVRRALVIDPDYGPARDNLARLTRGK